MRAALFAPLPSLTDNGSMALPIDRRSHYLGSALQRPMDEKAASEAVTYGDLADLATTDSSQTVARRLYRSIRRPAAA